MDKVIITKPVVNICGMQVCAEEGANDQEILEVCNSENPSGTSGGWGIVVHEVKKGSLLQIKKNLPVKCARYPDRTHFLVLC